jgi:hypothetical protein
MSAAVLMAEIANIALVLALLAAMHFYCRLPPIVFLILALHFALVFLTNHVLFPPSYMPDQFSYLRAAQAVREGAATVRATLSHRTVGAAAVLFAFFPIPVINSIYSISIINYILYLLAFGFFYHRGLLRGFSLWFFLLYPSLLLYSSVALRDTMVFVLMLASLYAFLQGRFLWSLVWQLPLLYLKRQNAVIYGLSLAIFWIVGILFPGLARRRAHPLIAVLFLSSVVLLSPLAYRYGLQQINKYRHRFWLEDAGVRFPAGPWTQIDGAGDLVVRTARGIPGFFFQPLPWQARNRFQLVQAVENLLIGLLVAFLIGRSVWKRVATPEMVFLLIFFVVSLAVYGLVIWNYGTAARYRFPFIAAFVTLYSALYDEEARRWLGPRGQDGGGKDGSHG